MYYRTDRPIRETRNSRIAAFILVLSGVFALSSLTSAQVPSDKNALLNGEVAGQAYTAETNGYPDPVHVLGLAKELQLTAKQAEAIQKIHSETLTRAKELGVRIVQIEEELDGSFKSAMLNERSIQDDAEQIGKLRGRLRAAHLVAHLKTRALLTQAQLAKYKELRSAPKETKK